MVAYAASAPARRARATSTMRTAVAGRTPASAASGIFATRGAAAKTITAKTTACVDAVGRQPAPVRTRTAVWAMAPRSGASPNSGAAMLAGS
ncbi:hypothetical protein M878_01580 [Streptomyces roseochromogenus subsp. oscitans DS 12.976]|uniref:Uncharacterized protein n=1 Tax=Streptomyces roseochromogenus subsp. oscitans DS 12.976 TaxID=1352936 RepID=V6L5V1_STRRC|nr:hypothetical protein M878_01580 [Streptomyces roseochromogenus subsp. oscitans DS 12.976]